MDSNAVATWPSGPHRTRLSRALAALAALLLLGTSQLATAEPDPDFDNAPAPESASGILVPRDRGARWRRVPRALLFVPRVLLEVPFAVPRHALKAYERYQLRDRYVAWFFNDDETIGLYPTALVETGFGLNVGARFVARELFGNNGTLRARGGYGGQFRQELSAEFTTGALLGPRVELGIHAEYKVFAKARFYGIGNADSQPVDGLMEIDPLVDDTAVATRFRHDDMRVSLAAVGHMTDELAVTLGATYSIRAFDDDVDLRGDADIRDVYDTTRLVGYETDLSNLYGGIELSYDSRRVTRHYLAWPAPSTGWRLHGHGGLQRGLGDDPSELVRWGADVQRYFDLWLGDRVLILRARAEGVSGDRDHIPFIDLPSLGGPYLLRGYSRDRFRGRYAGLLTAEYNYPVQRNASAYLFVDAGRVWRNWSDVENTELREVRLGFGGGIQLHSMRSFIGRLFVASSIDGGLFFNLSLDPAFTPRPQKER